MEQVTPQKTVAELRAELLAAEAAEKKVKEENWKHLNGLWKVQTAKPENYEWQVFGKNEAESGYHRSWCHVEPSGFPGYFSNGDLLYFASVQKRIKPSVVATFNKYYPEYKISEDEQRWRGMVYFRTTENILYHGGGGTYVFRGPLLCNDEEWSLILQGRPPAKFIL